MDVIVEDGQFNLEIKRGEDLELAAVLEFEGLTTLEGCEFYAQIREDYQAESAFDLVVEIDADPTTMAILIGLSASGTSAIPDRDYVWDCLMIEPSGRRTRILQGGCSISPEVTIHA